MKSYTAGTYNAKPSNTKPSWLVIDASDMVVGRLAAEISKLLRGKHKPHYTPHAPCGDKIVVVNASNIKFTGKKARDKRYYWHTGYPGGIRERTAEQVLDSRFPTRILEKAVRRMMPKESPLSRQLMKNLYLYEEESHPHQAQSPIKLDLASRNTKNKR